MQLNPLERRMSNIRLVPKVVLLMVFSTLLLLAKLWFDASNLEATLLSEGIDATMANATADASGKKPRLIRPANTLVIASSASNGAGAALLAAEQDKLGLIDGVVPGGGPARYLVSPDRKFKIGFAIPPYNDIDVFAQDLGFIASPHTSAGRVPTVRGYRLFVDSLLAVQPETGRLFDDSDAQQASTQSAIISHYHVVGEFNALLRFAVRDTQQLDQLLSLIKKFGDSRTSIELKTLFDSKEIPLP